MNEEMAAAAVGVEPEALRHWVQEGVVPEYEGEWMPAAVGKARLVKRILERGYTVEEVRDATDQGRLISGHLIELFGLGDERYQYKQIANETGLELGVVKQIAALLGLGDGEQLREPDRYLFRYIAKALEFGLPLEAMLQLTRVYVQAVSQIADAEVRLIHLYVHEPLIRSGTSNEEMSREMLALTEDLAPLANPLLIHLHARMLSHFIERDVVGHMEGELTEDAADVGRVLVAIAFADLTGYTALTDQEGDLHALDVVDRFMRAVNTTMPHGARVIKTIGDEVMVIGPDPEELTVWALALSEQFEPRPRIGVHYGYARYRDGDYYGREVNRAARVAARSGAGQVLVTQPVVEFSGPELVFESLGEVQLRGFGEPSEIFQVIAKGTG